MVTPIMPSIMPPSELESRPLTKAIRFDRAVEAMIYMDAIFACIQSACGRTKDAAERGDPQVPPECGAFASHIASLIAGDQRLVGARDYARFEQKFLATPYGRLAKGAAERMRRYRARKRAGIATVPRVTRAERQRAPSCEDAALRASLERNSDWLGTIRRDDDAGAQPIWRHARDGDVFGK